MQATIDTFEYHREFAGLGLITAGGNAEELVVVRTAEINETSAVFGPVAAFIAEHGLINVSRDQWKGDPVMVGAGAIRTVYRAA